MSTPTVVVATLEQLAELIEAAIAKAFEAGGRANPASPKPAIDRHQLAQALGISPASVGRFQREGAPHFFVGASPRFVLEDVRSWLVQRGRRGTTATPPKATTSIPGVRLISRGGSR